MPATPDYAADIVPRKNPAHIRVATFNCENLFDRPIAMNYADNKVGQPFLDVFSELNSIFAKSAYDASDKARILKLMKEQGLTATRPRNKHLEFRKIRGQLLKKTGNVFTVVANGRADWLGWIELKEHSISDQAIANTARVIAAVNADIQVLVEIEHRPALVSFHDGVLKPILTKSGRTGYPYIMLIDGNDLRGIDVAILSRFPITDMSSHVFDVPGAPAIFARDCAEFFLEVPGIAGRMIVMANHFNSKGSDPNGTKRRLPQSKRVVQIIDERLGQGFTHLVVAGDLNDTPGSASLAPLITHPQLKDAISQFAATIDPTGNRLGTYETGKQQIDYLLMSSPVSGLAKHAGIERRGHYAPKTWKAFDTIKDSRHDASDHHAVWVDLAI